MAEKSEEVVAYEGRIAEARASLLGLEDAVLALGKDIPTGEGIDPGEVAANVKIAYRHIEDARMRLGKVFQAMNGGVSNNDR